MTAEGEAVPFGNCSFPSCDFLLGQNLKCGISSCQTAHILCFCTNTLALPVSVMLPSSSSWSWASTTGSPIRRSSQQRCGWAVGWRHSISIPRTTLPFSARHEPSGSSQPRPASCTTSAVSPFKCVRPLVVRCSNGTISASSPDERD